MRVYRAALILLNIAILVAVWRLYNPTPVVTMCPGKAERGIWLI